MNRWLKFLLAALFGVIGYLLLLSSEWLPRPSAGQRAAMDLLGQPQPPVTGPGAFSVLWFLGRDIGDRDIEALMQQDVQAHATLKDKSDFTSVAAGLPAIPLLREPACAGFPESCLADLRSREDGGDALAARFAVHLARSEALLDATHYRYPFPVSDDLHIPVAAHTINLRRFANARRHLGVSPADGLGATCRELAVWRRLRPTADLLIHQMMAIAFAETQAGLLAEMLAEWPINQPLPASCEEALAPLVAAELDACDMWRGEYAWSVQNVESARGKPLHDEAGAPGWLTELLVNRRMMHAAIAASYAEGCRDFQARAAPAAGWIHWTFDPFGTALREVETEKAADDYHARFRQYLDVLRALRAQAWLRTQADPVESWARLPQDRRPQWLSLVHDPARRTLTLALFQPNPDSPEKWTLSLPQPLPARPPAG